MARPKGSTFGIKRTGPRRVLKAVEKMMLHLTAYQAKNLEAMVVQAMEPLMESLDDFSRRMKKLEKRVAWATRPNRRPPGRPPKKRGPGRPPNPRPVGRPPKKRGPGRPPKKRGPGRPPNKRGPGRPPKRRGPGRPPKNPV